MVPCVTVNRCCLGTCSAWEQNTTGERNSGAVNTVQNIISLWTELQPWKQATSITLPYNAFPFPSVLWLHNFTAASLWAAAGRWILACGLHKSWYLVEKCLGKEFSNVLCFRKRLLKTSQVSQLLRNDQNSSIAPTSFALTLRKTLNCSYNKWLFPSWLLAWSQSGIARENI